METLAFSLELKAADDAAGTFEGYASVFGERDGGGDIVERGAFTKTLKARTPRGVKMLADHDPTKRVGVWEAMAEDEHGLYVRGRLLTEKQIGREAYIDLKAGALDGLSIGYRVKGDAYDGRRRARLLKEIDLVEVSLVSFPMLESARVSAVKAAKEIETKREFERFLRDAGFSRSRACELASYGWKEAPGDQEADDLAERIRRLTERLRA